MENEASVSVAKTNRWAVISPMFGILSILALSGAPYVLGHVRIDLVYLYACASTLMGPAGIVTGIIALKQIKHAGSLGVKGRGLAITGIILSLLGLFPCLLIILGFMML